MPRKGAICPWPGMVWNAISRGSHTLRLSPTDPALKAIAGSEFRIAFFTGSPETDTDFGPALLPLELEEERTVRVQRGLRDRSTPGISLPDAWAGDGEHDPRRGVLAVLDLGAAAAPPEVVPVLHESEPRTVQMEVWTQGQRCDGQLRLFRIGGGLFARWWYEHSYVNERHGVRPVLGTGSVSEDGQVAWAEFRPQKALPDDSDLPMSWLAGGSTFEVAQGAERAWVGTSGPGVVDRHQDPPVFMGGVWTRRTTGGDWWLAKSDTAKDASSPHGTAWLIRRQWVALRRAILSADDERLDDLLHAVNGLADLLPRGATYDD